MVAPPSIHNIQTTRAYRIPQPLPQTLIAMCADPKFEERSLLALWAAHAGYIQLLDLLHLQDPDCVHSVTPNTRASTAWLAASRFERRCLPFTISACRHLLQTGRAINVAGNALSWTCCVRLMLTWRGLVVGCVCACVCACACACTCACVCMYVSVFVSIWARGEYVPARLLNPNLPDPNPTLTCDVKMLKMLPHSWRPR